DEQQPQAEQRGPGRRRRGVVVRRGVLRRQEVVAVADGLDEHEDAVQRERGGPGERELRGRVRGPGGRGRETRQDEREGGDRGERGEGRRHALDPELQLVVAQR